VQTGVVHRSERQVALDRTIVAAIVLGLFAFYVSIQAGVLVSRDAHTMASVGRNLVQHGSLHRYLPGRPKAWSPYGIGVSLVTVPLWALQLHVAPHGEGWVSSGNAVITAVTGGFLYRCGVEIGWRRTVAVITVLVFGLLTMAPVYSTEMFSEPGVTLGIVVTLLGLLLWSRRSRHGPWLVGVGLSVAVLFRTDSYVTVVLPTLVLVPLFIPPRELRSTARRWLAPVAVPLIVVSAWTVVYNVIRFRTAFVTSYGGVSFTNPLADGLYRQVLSPGKGFFWYDPILLVGLFGVVLLYRRRRALAIAIAVLSVTRVLVFAKWPFPDGSVAWGPRFLVPLCALLSLGVGEAIARSEKLSRGRRLWARGLIVVLGAAGAFVNVLSLWVPYEQQHREFTARGTLPTDHALALVEIQRRQALTYNRWSHTPLRYAVTHLAHASRTGVGFPLRWWQGGWSVPGVTALVVAIAALSFALRAAGHDSGGLEMP
jgi:4-amino-4-deoxy-L-arabinose transferase-like glycosyltransferase